MQDALLARGPPPLYRSAADASIDLIDFMAAAVRGVDLIDVEPGMRETWRSYLATRYSTLPPAQRQWLVDAPTIVGEFTARWAQASASDRKEIARQWAPSVRGLLEFADPALSSAQNAGQQRLSRSAAEPDQQGRPAPDAIRGWPSAFLNERFSQQRAALREAQARSPEEAARLRAQHDSINSEFLTTVSSTRYRDLMAVIQNLRA